MESHVLLVLTDADVSTLNGLGDSTITIQDAPSQEGYEEKSLEDETRVVTIITHPNNANNESDLVEIEEVHCVYSDTKPVSKSVGVQVEAEEDQLRRSAGLPPNRRLSLPMRYGGYVLDDKEDSDSDYCPQEESRAVKVKRKRVGRPRKQPARNTPDGAPAVKVLKDKDLPFSCEVCQKRFSQKGNMKSHMRTHSVEKPFMCETCGKSFKGKDALLRHKMLHTGEKPFPCPDCDARLSSAMALKEHQTLHSGETLYQCNICSRRFRFSSIYRRHLTTHTGEKPFSCSVCGRRFSLRGYLNSHMKTHTGERPFSCSVCSKRFAHLSDVARHHKTHTGDKPYSCNHCGATFSDPSSRRRHEREHTRTKLFACEICQEAFKRPGQLKQHQLRCNRARKSSDMSTDQPLLEGSPEEATAAVRGILESVTSSEHLEPASVISDESLQEVISVQEAQDDNNNMCDQQKPFCESPRDVSENSINGDGALCAGSPDHPTHASASSPVAALQDSSINSASNITTEDDAHCTLSNVDESHIVSSTTEPSATILESLLSSTTVVNYVNNPDFGCQDYYNWLSNFTTVAKLLPVPLQSEIFSKISQVHKTLADVLASPSGVLATKENFQIVLSISKDLHCVITSHLSHVFDCLES